MTTSVAYAPVASHSQCGEDLQIAYYIGYKAEATYIDIGCLWPKAHSNSYYFYERGGHGLCIDANPTVAQEFTEERPNDIFLNRGIAEKRGSLLYYVYENPVFNTFSSGRAEELQRQAPTRRGRDLVTTQEVPVSTLDEAVAETAFVERVGDAIDFMTIDVEGLEVAVLSGFSFVPRPRLIVSEHLRRRLSDPPATEVPVAQLVADHGYWLAGYTGHDLYFLSE